VASITSALRRQHLHRTSMLDTRVTVPQATREHLDAVARRQGRSRSAVVREAVEMWLAIERQRPGRA
jgi:metal-responsive CopG/Arc/MetJ family transcriptional regulator